MGNGEGMMGNEMKKNMENDMETLILGTFAGGRLHRDKFGIMENKTESAIQGPEFGDTTRCNGESNRNAIGQ